MGVRFKEWLQLALDCNRRAKALKKGRKSSE